MRLLQRLRGFFWPRGVQCLVCGFGCPGDVLCPDCRAELNQRRFPAQEGPDASVWLYGGAARALITSLKYENLGPCADVLADGMAETLCTMKIPEDTVLTWVTMPEKRLRERGIDHGRILCEAVAARCGLPARMLLARTGKVHTQRGLNREQRLQNLRHSMSCEKELPPHILLIDDVSTTGATVRACRETLMAGGAKTVFSLTAAKVEKRTDI